MSKVYGFRSASKPERTLEISVAGWAARVRRSEGDGWTMRVDYSGGGQEWLFYADGHPENKYPPTERPASPVELATFLEECQRYVAEREKA